MKTSIKRVVFSIGVTMLVYFIGRAFGVNLFILGWWCAFVYQLSEEILYFSLFPQHQKYVIRFTEKGNEYLHEWLTSMNPDDKEVKSKKKELALKFDNEYDAREVLYNIQHEREPWGFHYVDVKKYYN